MYLTEDEAKKSWCPAARMGDISNRGANKSAYTTCLGSGCMAWRWGDDAVMEHGLVVHKDTPHSRQVGYCGLGGKPTESD